MASQTTETMTELTLDECLERLRQGNFGRLGIVVHGQPLIFPVNYVLDNSYVVFRSGRGIKLSFARLDKVAFEVDEVDPSTNEGWSVTVTGTAVEITNAIDNASVRELALPLVPLVGGDKDHWVRIINPSITGRRLRPRRDEAILASHVEGATRQ